MNEFHVIYKGGGGEVVREEGTENILVCDSKAANVRIQSNQCDLWGVN